MAPMTPLTRCGLVSNTLGHTKLSRCTSASSQLSPATPREMCCTTVAAV